MQEFHFGPPFICFYFLPPSSFRWLSMVLFHLVCLFSVESCIHICFVSVSASLVVEARSVSFLSSKQKLKLYFPIYCWGERLRDLSRSKIQDSKACILLYLFTVVMVKAKKVTVILLNGFAILWCCQIRNVSSVYTLLLLNSGGKWVAIDATHSGVGIAQ